ncbi:hypothetical protein LUZ60_014874 [Juncus effusus]|nr:hypothetical protein LUZ60_014874 [Juncus effusus]
MSCCMAFESWIEEKAREELNKLETLHPNRFDFLKTELKFLISEPEWEPLFITPQPISFNFSQCEPSSQVSSNQKRKFNPGMERENKWKEKKGKDRVETAIERAEACLQRIQEVKRSLMVPVRA